MTQKHDANRGRGTRRGFTLLEGMISVVIIGTVMTVVAAGVKSSSDLATEEANRNALERSANTALSQMAQELRQSEAVKVIRSNTDHSYVVFQYPVDLDNDGTVVKNANSSSVEYGCVNRHLQGGVYVNTNVAGYVRYEFVQNSTRISGAKEILSESARHLDLNNNGNQADRYDVGHIDRVVLDATNTVVSRKTITDPCVIQYFGNRTLEPIFMLNGNQLTIALWQLKVDGHNRVHSVRTSTVVNLRNQ